MQQLAQSLSQYTGRVVIGGNFTVVNGVALRGCGAAPTIRLASRPSIGAMRRYTSRGVRFPVGPIACNSRRHLCGDLNGFGRGRNGEQNRRG